jgi:mannose-6-phosphate isomerase-like protein (cupin superfamily)
MRRMKAKTPLQPSTAHFRDLVFQPNAFLDAYLPGRDRLQAQVIGEGVVETAMRPPIVAEAEFTVSYTRVPPGNGNSLHDHKTHEVFIPLSSRWRIVWGAEGEHSAELEPYDIISIPPGLHRHYTNIGNTEGLLLTVLGGRDSGKVTWAKKVLDEARERGVSLDEKGEIVQAR